MTITSSTIWDTITSAVPVDSDKLDSVSRNRVYCLSCWDLGLTVGKPAYRKFVRHNGRKNVPQRRHLSPVGYMTSSPMIRHYTEFFGVSPRDERRLTQTMRRAPARVEAAE